MLKGVRIDHIDGYRIPENVGTMVRLTRFEILPGWHSVGVGYVRVTRGFFVTEIRASKNHITVCFVAEAGSQYQVTTIVNEKEDRWDARIVEERTKRFVEEPCRRAPPPVVLPPRVVAPPRKSESNSALVAVAERLNEKAQRVGYERLAAEERVFLAVWMLERAVYAGGFEQYFQDPSGDQAGIVSQGLRALGADATAQMVEQAIQPFGGGGVPADRTKRREQIGRFPVEVVAHWRRLDERFVKDPDNLSQLLESYATERLR